jgi:hypothetical protein
MKIRRCPACNRSLSADSPAWFNRPLLKVRPPRSKNRRHARTGKSAALPLTPRRKWLFRFIALIVLPLLLLSGVETALRLAGYGHSTGFFKKNRLGQTDFLVNNEDFSLRFFPPQLARWANPFIFPAAKPPDTVRIFILGESAAMGDPEPAYGPARYLEMQLREGFPGEKFEIVNVAFTAINSHVIVPIARECAEHGGDVWIIYMGNNEMVGPFGPATVFGARSPPLPLIRLNLAIQKTRLGQWLVSLERKFNRADTNAASWGGMQMFLQNQVAPDNPSKENVYRNFEANLEDIVRVGLGSGARLLLNTVAVNLKDCPPFASVMNSNLTPGEHAQFDRLYVSGLQAEAQNDFAGAAELFGQVAKLDAKSAELQFHWGECLLAKRIFPPHANTCNWPRTTTRCRSARIRGSTRLSPPPVGSSRATGWLYSIRLRPWGRRPRAGFAVRRRFTSMFILTLMAATGWVSRGRSRLKKCCQPDSRTAPMAGFPQNNVMNSSACRTGIGRQF